jgi:hypothetical protein
MPDLQEIMKMETTNVKKVVNWKGSVTADTLTDDGASVSLDITFPLDFDQIQPPPTTPIGVTITIRGEASSVGPVRTGTISSDSAGLGIIHMTGTVIETADGYRFVPDYNNTMRMRLTNLSPAGDATPESEEVDLAPYAGKRIRFICFSEMQGTWVYGVQNIEVL